MYKNILTIICLVLFTAALLYAQDTASDEAAIKALIEKQSSTFTAGDFDAYQTVWAHEPYVLRLGNFGRRTIGWDDLGAKYKYFLETAPRTSEDVKTLHDKYHIKVYDDVAWAVNWQITGTDLSGEPGIGGRWHSRFFEKQEGEWKIVFQVDRKLPLLPEISGQELWDKTIAYHDPKGVWDKFSGKVHIFTTRPKGNYSEEIIELDKPNDFYQSRRIDGKIGLVRGVKKGEYFGSVDEGDTDAHKKLAKNWLGEEKVKRMKEHHTCHFGLPMQLKVAGLKAEENVTAVDWFGTTCYRLRLTGTEDSVIHPYYAGTWTLFIEPDNFKTVGLGYKSSNSEYYIKLAGELDVNGVKMQQTKIFYNAKDDSHAGTDNFTLVKE